MKCPKCHSDNPPDSSFCGKCGIPMARNEPKSPQFSILSPDLSTETLPTPVQELTTGSTFASRYQIIKELGKGGMGEVYQAKDQKLGRDVAIKVLPEEFAKDADRVARFQREAKLLASLNHPNIAAIHELEESGGTNFLVLELVEGQTLADRIKAGPIPVEESLKLALQIAEALEAAHEKGIIHRDLKPANIKVTPKGKVKVLDFGLAKAFAGDKADLNLSNPATLSMPATESGVILGTAAYMSPEQARGESVDKRADIWAFGVVLYEMLTGRQLFAAGTISETLAAVLTKEPDWEKVPARVRPLLRRCLRKDPGERLHDIADARIEIEESDSQPVETATVSGRFSFPWIIAGAVIMIIAGLLIGHLVWNPAKPAPSLSVTESVIKLESGCSLAGHRASGRPTRTAMAISSDGRFIVYSAVDDSAGPEAKSRLYLRRTDQLEAKPIPATDGGIAPFLSPDDRWIGFWIDRRLMKVSVDGGLPVSLCEIDYPCGASWSADNTIVLATGMGSRLFRVSADGGTPEALTTADKTKGEFSHCLPHLIPHSKDVLFTIMREFSDLHPSVAALDSDTGKYHIVLEDAADACYVPTGHLVFLRQGTLMAVPFDLNKLEVRGQPVPAVANVMQALNIVGAGLNTGAGQFSISDSGWLAYTSGGIVPDLENLLVWVDRKGTAQPITSFKASFFNPRLSPDGRQIAYRAWGKECKPWIYDLSRGTAHRLGGEGKVTYISWTPDGKRVVFGWNTSLVSNLYWQPADGSSPMERLTTSEYRQNPGSWTPDGHTLAFCEGHGHATGADIYLLRIPERSVTPFLKTTANESYPEFSPDGRWLAYCLEESGRDEVYVRPFPGPGSLWQISQQGGSEPLWARNGKQIFYRLGNQVWVVDVQTEPAFSASKPRLLFEKPGYAGGGPIRGWDISPDGQRFLMVKLDDRKPQPVTEMILVQNWFEELKRLAPVK